MGNRILRPLSYHNICHRFVSSFKFSGTRSFFSFYLVLSVFLVRFFTLYNNCKLISVPHCGLNTNNYKINLKEGRKEIPSVQCLIQWCEENEMVNVTKGVH